MCSFFFFFGGDKCSALSDEYQKYGYCIIQHKCVEFCEKSLNCLLKWLPFCIPISNEWKFLLLCIFASIWHFPDTSHFRNGMDLKEAEDIKKRWQEYTEELYKKDLHDPDNHNGVITHTEPDILECEVKWALGSITTNKAGGGDGIAVELFQILKYAVKVLHSICQQIWKIHQWPQDWKRSIFIIIPRRAMQKNAQTTTELHSSHTLAK